MPEELTSPSPEQPKKKRRKRRTKAEIAADKAAKEAEVKETIAPEPEVELWTPEEEKQVDAEVATLFEESYKQEEDPTLYGLKKIKEKKRRALLRTQQLKHE